VLEKQGFGWVAGTTWFDNLQIHTSSMTTLKLRGLIDEPIRVSAWRADPSRAVSARCAAILNQTALA